MHKTRSNRRRNQTRRLLAARKQTPLPADEQVKRAENRELERAAEWTDQGHNRPNYEGKPRRRRKRLVMSSGGSHRNDALETLEFFISRIVKRIAKQFSPRAA